MIPLVASGVSFPPTELVQSGKSIGSTCCRLPGVKANCGSSPVSRLTAYRKNLDAAWTLAACVFYTLLFKTSPAGLPGILWADGKKLVELEEKQALFLQKAAFEPSSFASACAEIRNGDIRGLQKKRLKTEFFLTTMISVR